jgi:hypothetical protein
MIGDIADVRPVGSASSDEDQFDGCEPEANDPRSKLKVISVTSGQRGAAWQE